MDHDGLFAEVRSALDARRAKSSLLDLLAPGSNEAESLAALAGLFLARRIATTRAPEGPLADLIAQAEPSAEDIAQDVTRYVERDFTASHPLDILLFSDGFHALSCHRRAHTLWAAGRRDDARLLCTLGARALGAELHPAAVLGQRIFLDHGRGVVIGETAVIGDDCAIFQGVTLGSTAKHPGQRHPTLGRAVTVGAGAKIIGAIHIGDRATIAPNSVVTRDVPARDEGPA